MLVVASRTQTNLSKDWLLQLQRLVAAAGFGVGVGVRAAYLLAWSCHIGDGVGVGVID